ncbi:hypothetical protein NPIL_481431 [Nephila pilipes]|uniref:Uncharacterized protein n=1 Tax=Nephila pilipes TaxID=299642 RepID=A0A8X6N6Q8_NEPPI|nr:hypothetical protein NPIL_481431 [Nephila pilipes]
MTFISQIQSNLLEKIKEIAFYKGEDPNYAKELLKYKEKQARVQDCQTPGQPIRKGGTTLQEQNRCKALIGSPPSHLASTPTLPSLRTIPARTLLLHVHQFERKSQNYTFHI